MIHPNDFVIGDDNFEQLALITHIDGKRIGGENGYGLVPRDYDANPLGSMRGSMLMEAVTDMPLIPMEEWPERIAEKVANKSQLSDIRMRGNNGAPIPSLDQNGQGYCWSYSTTSAAMLLRAAANMPYVRLSGHANAWVIKGGRDQGGWGAQSLDRAMSHGIPSVEFWKEKSMSSSNNTPETWENAKLHRIAEGWIDLQAAQYDRNLSAQQVGTVLLCNVPGIFDFNHWSHSVAGMDLVDAYPNRSARDIYRYGVRIWNSWRDSWGQLGTAVLKDRKAWPDGATAPRSITLSDL